MLSEYPNYAAWVEMMHGRYLGVMLIVLLVVIAAGWLINVRWFAPRLLPVLRWVMVCAWWVLLGLGLAELLS